jgi:DNA modification methylase
MTDNYEEFIKTKQFEDVKSGFEPGALNPNLFEFQEAITRWALRRGRAAIFANTGLGKTLMQMAWADEVCEHTGGRVLVVAPLAVAKQSVNEAAKFGITAQYVREQPSGKFSEILVTNYEMLEKFDLSTFEGVVLDESSIIKNRDGKTRKAIIESCQRVPYRLSCTATPSPNDYMELGNQSEFLGVMGMNEMLAMFFTHDGGDTSKWRLKGHGERKFWEWMATWAITITKPSDLGFSDEGYDLPPLNMHEHMVKSPESETGLFVDIARTLNERRQAKKDTLAERVAKVADLCNDNDDQWLVWCHTNDESAMLAKAIDGAVEVKGSDTADHKERAIESFINYGKQCFCDKLAENKPENSQCQKKLTSKNTTSVTEKSERRSQPNTSAETEKSAESTCESTQSETETSSAEHLSSKQSTTSVEKSGTPTASVSAQRPEKQLQTGNKEIQKSGLPKGLENTESPLTNTMQCSTSKAGAAQSAEALTQKTEEQSACSSTTATKQAGSEDCFARPAISESENLRTSQNCSCQQQNTSKARVLISKPSIFGFGLNLQMCQNMAFVGLDDSYEQMYQAIRRCWRFGQTKPVNVHIVTAEALGAIKANIERKEKQMEQMQLSMVDHMRDAMQKEIKGAAMEKDDYNRQVYEGRDFTIHNADCVHLAREIESDSVGYTIFSPPFASLYTYSNSDYDMGNAKDDDQFYAQFKYLVAEMYRITKPGRLLSFHCMNLPTSKQNDGYIGIRDFRGDLIKMFQDEGWIYHSEVCIWKDPVTAMQRTKALGLLHKTIRKDSAMSRQGIPDYLVTMRKPGENNDPISHTHEEFPVQLWQRYASPVWMDINPSRTLNFRDGRDEDDERHICPLQLDVIERGLDLWSKPGDLVFSPFTGIGSEGYCAVKKGRRFIGSELKSSYYELAIRNIEEAYNTTMDMFSTEETS